MFGTDLISGFTNILQSERLADPNPVALRISDRRRQIFAALINLARGLVEARLLGLLDLADLAEHAL